MSLDHEPVLCGPNCEASQVAYGERTFGGSCTTDVSVTATWSSMPLSNKRTSPTFFGLKYVMDGFRYGHPQRSFIPDERDMGRR
jgi:hypothetical protein